MLSLLSPLRIKITHPVDGNFNALLQCAPSLSIEQNRVVLVAPSVVKDKDLLSIRAPGHLPMIHRLTERVNDARIASILFKDPDCRWPTAVWRALFQKSDPATV